MSAFSDVENFVRVANRLTRPDELEAVLTGAVRTFGFDHVALVHHVDRSTPESQRAIVEFIDYPEEWRVVMRKRGYFAEDPILAACQKSAAAFRWSDVPSIAVLSAKQLEILASASDCGMGDGFTVPLNVPGEFLGSCSFAMRAGHALPRHSLPAAQYIACFAFEAARRLRQAEMEGMKKPIRPRLTTRQFDCLVLAAQGRSDWHIAKLLGISADTVHQHIETAKRRYGVSSRTQLVVRALYDSQITFADVIR